MQLQEQVTTTVWQITFHYINGQTESFNVYDLIDSGTTHQDVRQEIRRFMKEDWWAIKTLDETIFIKSANVMKVEVKPPIESIQGEGFLSEAERVTALTRGGRSI
ncbi:MAG: hypothetical protein KME08_16830 [Aphanothece sp. CMT-3BRIN-NPC111]|jgi:hypothetical protein|nr:hypothetical protein [Aphanothece sp. CMT-3BRIN-NPC111]